MFEKFQNLRDPEKREDILRYDAHYVISLTKEENELLIKELPEEYPGTPFRSYCETHGASAFGSANVIYEHARWAFCNQYTDHKSLRVVDWIALCRAWAMSNNKEVKLFAACFAMQTALFSAMEATLIATDCGPILGKNGEHKLLNALSEAAEIQQNLIREWKNLECEEK